MSLAVDGTTLDQYVSPIGSPAHKPDDPVKPSSRESRIQARRARVELARNARSNSDQDPSSIRIAQQDPSEAKEGKPTTQIKASKQRIVHVKRKGLEDVSQVKSVAIQREQKRRTDERVRVGVISAKAKKTLETCEELDIQIQKAWEKCISMSESLGNPYEFHDMLLSQRALCKELLNAKENLLVEYNTELKRKDDEYVKELKRQAEEIDSLLHRMDQQYVAFKKSLLEELVHIEREFMTERTENINSNVKEIQDLFQTQKESESRYLEERSQRIHDNTEALEDLRVQDAEGYNLVKIKLESDVQKLEQQLQQMKATYQLNAEKLEYNYQVLKKRDDENSITIKQQKRRITRMTDLANNLKVKLAKQEKQFLSEYTDLQQDFNRISSQYHELTMKFKHFQVNGEIKFSELWEMNQETIKDLVAKVLLADLVIHQQQLGIPQEPLPEPFHQVNEVAKDGVKAPGTHANLPKDTSTQPMAVLLISSKIAIVQRIIEMLSTEATFLLDQKLTRLLVPLPPAERALLKLDTILRALNIGSAPDLVLFLQLFLLPKYHGSASDLAADILNGRDSGHTEAMLIHPNQVTKILIHHFETHSTDSTKSPHRAVDQNTQNGSYTSKDLGKQHWDHVLTLLNSSRFKNWETVLQCMDAYHLLLTARHELTSEVIDLETQNAELKNLLREYMSANVNKSLQVPPSQVILSQIHHHQKNQQQQQQQQQVPQKSHTGSYGGMPI